MSVPRPHSSNSSSSRERTTPPPPPKPAATATEPHPTHEGHPSTTTAAFRKPIPLPVPIMMPTPTPLADPAHQSPASAPQTPSILRVASPLSLDQSNAVAGPSNHGKNRVSIHDSSEDENAASPGNDHSPGRRPVSARGDGDGSGNGNGNGNGSSHSMPTHHTTPQPSIRRPARALSSGGQTIRQTSAGHARSITLPDVRPLPSGSGIASDLNPEGMRSNQSEVDWIVPRAGPTLGTNGNGRRNSGFSQAATLTTGERNVEQRLKPTLDAAISERDKAALKAKAHAWALNCAIGAQVVLGALTTGVAAATTGRQTSIATSVLGGMSTLAASYLAKARGSGEPEVSSIRSRDLDSFIRDCQAFVLDRGFVVGPEFDPMIERYRRRFEEIMGSGAGGVGDQVKAQREREKTTLPV